MQERHKCKNISLHVRLSISYSIILKHESFSQILDRFPRTLLLPLSKQFNLFSRGGNGHKTYQTMGIFCCNRHLSVFLLGKFRPGWKKVQFLGRLFAELSFDPRLNRSFDSSDSVGDISNVLCRGEVAQSVEHPSTGPPSWQLY